MIQNYFRKTVWNSCLSFIVGLIIVIMLFFVAIVAPFIIPYDPNAIDVESILFPPSMKHFFGTDELGRDVFSRMIYGSRISLQVGLFSTVISTFFGLFLGAIAGYYGCWVEVIIMRFIDMMFCFPTFFLVLAVVTLLDPSIINIIVVIGFTSWMNVARLVRAELISIKEQEYILAARSLGASDARIILRHLLPNAIAPILVTSSLGVAGAILLEGGLSFLGIGIQPPDASWGNILSQGKTNIEIAWWLSLFPGLAFLLAVLGYNLLGEGIRDIFDPHFR